MTPPADASALVIAHGSCRRPYAEGQDGLVALDQIIDRGREGPPAGPRPHYMFMTGDQIYADDLSNEMLAWASDASLDLIGKTSAGNAVEQLRVELPDQKWSRTVSFPADRTHFPAGRRARLGTRAAGLTSEDTQNHALSFGEIAAHYLLSWSNVLWPLLDDAATWKAQYQQRGALVRDYLTAWQASYAKARARVATRSAGQQGYSVSTRPTSMRGSSFSTAGVCYRSPAGASISSPSRRFRTGTAPAHRWTGSTSGKPPPRPSRRHPKPSVRRRRSRRAHSSNTDDLRDLANLMTPAWYAGRQHFAIEHDYGVGDVAAPPTSVDDLELTSDAVLERLKRLKGVLRGPTVRTAGTRERVDADDVRRP